MDGCCCLERWGRARSAFFALGFACGGCRLLPLFLELLGLLFSLDIFWGLKEVSIDGLAHSDVAGIFAYLLPCPEWLERVEKADIFE
jgi:hypothetical protein